MILPEGADVDTLPAVQRQDQLWYIVCIAPEKDQPHVEGTFKQMVDSVSFRYSRQARPACGQRPPPLPR